MNRDKLVTLTDRFRLYCIRCKCVIERQELVKVIRFKHYRYYRATICDSCYNSNVVDSQPFIRWVMDEVRMIEKNHSVFKAPEIIQLKPIPDDREINC